MGTCLLTGASSGIGRSLARHIAHQGESVVVLARRKPLLDSLVDEIAQAGGRAIAIACDVTDRAQVLAAASDAQAAFGPIERLVACAGGGERTYVDKFESAHIEEVVALNLFGTAHCIEAVLPGMLERGSGHLVAVSSLAAYRGLPEAAAYSAAKAALSNMMESLRIDLAPRGVSVTLLCPGFVRTKVSDEKPKPFELELEAATQAMCRAIMARKPYYAFPRPLALAAAWGRTLPAAAYDWLVAGKGS